MFSGGMGKPLSLAEPTRATVDGKNIVLSSPALIVRDEYPDVISEADDSFNLLATFRSADAYIESAGEQIIIMAFTNKRVIFFPCLIKAM